MIASTVLLLLGKSGHPPSAELANSMLDKAITLLKEEHPIVYFDRGGYYRWAGWTERKATAGLTRSMSKKGVLRTILPAKAFWPVSE